jgi:hypothetical protein
MNLTVNTYHYQCLDEIRIEYPQYKSFELVHQAPRGQSLEVQKEGLRKAMMRRGRWSPVAFQIGDMFYIPAATTPALPKEPTLCHE